MPGSSRFSDCEGRGLGTILEGLLLSSAAGDDAADPNDTSDTILTSRARLFDREPCLGCNGDENLSRLEPCQHRLCATCIKRIMTGDTLSKGQIIICPRCKSFVDGFDPPPPVDPQASQYSHALKSQSPPRRPTNNVRGGERMRRSISNSSTHSAVLRITGFPWRTRTADVELLVEPLVGEVGVHILQDRHIDDGRTLEFCFVEVLEGDDAALNAVDTLNGQKLLGANITCAISTQEEMLGHIFPSWLPGFKGGQPFFLHNGQPFEGNFLEEEEIFGLEELCKLSNSRVRIAAERPFLNVATCISKMPWRQPYLYSSTFATSLMSLALGALNTLFTSAYGYIPDYLDVATKLAQSVYDCPIAQAADVEGVGRILDLYWPVKSPSSLRIPKEPYFSPQHSPTPPVSWTPGSTQSEPIMRTPPQSVRSSLEALPPPRGTYSPPALYTEKSYARRRPDSSGSHTAIALELGVSEELVRAIARRLR